MVVALPHPAAEAINRVVVHSAYVSQNVSGRVGRPLSGAVKPVAPSQPPVLLVCYFPNGPVPSGGVVGTKTAVCYPYQPSSVMSARIR